MCRRPESGQSFWLNNFLWHLTTFRQSPESLPWLFIYHRWFWEKEGPQRGSKTLTAALHSFLRKMLLPPTHIRIRCDGPFAICGGCYPLDIPSSSRHLPGPGCVQQYPLHLLYSVSHSLPAQFSQPPRMANGPSQWMRVCVCVCVYV